jgi:acetyl-CoA synthetase/medium-chain acyl-CoA synthetase
MGNIGDYGETRKNFRWNVPDDFNFGRDVVDRYAKDRTKLAFFYEDEDGNKAKYTFWEVSRISNRVGNVLRSLGVKKGDPVLVLLQNVPEWYFTMVAGNKIGAIVIPCSDQLRPKDLVYRALHSGASTIVSWDAKTAEVDAIRKECPALVNFLCVGRKRDGWRSFTDETSNASPELEVEPCRANEPALVYYTSGTTGNPKAVMHSHFYTGAHWVTGKYWIDLKPTDLLWCIAGTGWAKAAWSVLFGPWNNGAATLLLNAPFHAKRGLAWLAGYEVTVLCAPPTAYRAFVKEDLGVHRLPSLRHCVGAGEPLNPEVIKTWKDALGITIHDGYGQTETINLVANFPGMPVKPGSMGLPVPGHEVAVIDEKGNEAPAGEIGEIAVKGRPPALFMGYWKDEGKTKECFRGDWYLTGDRAYRDGDGYFFFVGRGDDVIISSGYRIGPFEVESALLEHPAVVESAVVSSPDDLRGEIVKAYVVLRAGYEPGDALKKELQEHVKKVTAPYKYPRDIAFVTELPKTTSGKIRRIELRAEEWKKKQGTPFSP